MVKATLMTQITFWPIIIITIIYFIIGILLAIWVYTDARKRDMDAPVWLLIVLLTGCIGCIIYLVVRNQ
ncbi:MAG: hypothetical protein EU550_01620 [Promethearchaeota archaeon]|nr:MAG: hypothetical protein EU550_01620 [Candidatus Lokiarchaeota archaeon]